MRGKNGEYDSADNIRPIDTAKYFTSKGRIVYGGGGITPDTFVPYEQNNLYVRQIIGSRIIRDYVMIFGDRHRNELNNITDLSQLEKFFAKNDPLPEFNEYVKRKGIKGADKDIAEAKEWINIYLKSYISQTTPLSDLGSAFLSNKFDKTVLKALEIINTQTQKDNV
jgi:carboxyl-terminal processing protease